MAAGTCLDPRTDHSDRAGWRRYRVLRDGLHVDSGAMSRIRAASWANVSVTSLPADLEPLPPKPNTAGRISTTFDTMHDINKLIPEMVSRHTTRWIWSLCVVLLVVGAGRARGQATTPEPPASVAGSWTITSTGPRGDTETQRIPTSTKWCGPHGSLREDRTRRVGYMASWTGNTLSSAPTRAGC